MGRDPDDDRDYSNSDTTQTDGTQVDQNSGSRGDEAQTEFPPDAPSTQLASASNLDGVATQNPLA
jgi:hypothetical protein